MAEMQTRRDIQPIVGVGIQDAEQSFSLVDSHPQQHRELFRKDHLKLLFISKKLGSQLYNVNLMHL